MKTKIIALTLFAFSSCAQPALAVRLDPTNLARRAQAAMTTYSVPGPAGAATVVRGPCPGWPPDMVLGCTFRDGRIYLAQWDRLVFAHELGHLFDYRNLDDAERAKLKQDLSRGQIKLDPNAAWNDCKGEMGFFDYGNCAQERFADAYAACALKLVPERVVGDDPVLDWVAGNWETTYGWFPTLELHRRVCRLLWRFADVDRDIMS